MPEALKPEMTSTQFDALAKLTRARRPDPVKRVLVEGVKIADAAHEAGISPNALGQSVRSMREAFAIIDNAWKATNGRSKPVAR